MSKLNTPWTYVELDKKAHKRAKDCAILDSRGKIIAETFGDWAEENAKEIVQAVNGRAALSEAQP